MQRVVITGLGSVSPVGNDVESSWRALLAGRSGIGRISHFEPAEFPIQIAGEVKQFALDPAIDLREARRMSRYSQLALNAALEAWRDAGLDMAHEDREQVGVVFGSGAGGLDLIVEQQEVLRTRGYRRVAPLLIANMIDDAASGQIAIALGAQGPNLAVVSACSTGGGNVGEAYETIRRGDAEVMLAGGSEAPILPLVLASFTTMKGLAAENELPARACKPFDAKRDGFVLSEGAAALVLESLAHAQRRGARIYAEVLGSATSADAVDMVAADAEGLGISRAMRRALKKAAVPLETVGYINAHGTGTPLNDRVETLAIKRIFGEQAYRLAVSSTKSMVGHMMGAAGAFELVVCALALHEGRVPPTINYARPDPDCDLDYVPNLARELPLEVALSNSIGLGGHNSCVVLGRFG
jgi:beta-ketoacyl-acyl-carrier-protein synthase II